MIKEHEDVMDGINLILTEIFKPYAKYAKFTVKYLDVEFHAIEVRIHNEEYLNLDDCKKLEKEFKKFNDIVTDIYTIEEGKLYTIFLKPIEDIRIDKISKLQNKITNEADNKI
jgi:hypothetical protein